jgi:hypothetical protein
VKKLISRAAEADEARRAADAEKVAADRLAEAERLRLEQESSERKRARVLDQIAGKARECLDVAHASDETSRQSIRWQFEQAVNEQCADAERHASAVAAKLSEKKEIGKIAILMAMDTIKGTDGTAVYLAPILQPVSELMLKLEVLTQNALGNVCGELEAHSNTLSAAVLQEITGIGIEEEVDIRAVSPAMDQMVGRIQSLQLNLITAVALAPLEFGGVLALRRLLWLSLERIVQRAVTTAGLNLALVASDGPLPVGDALALSLDVLFLACSAYDIHQISKELPGQIRERILTSIELQRKNAVNVFYERSGSWIRRTHSDRTEALKDVLNPR